MRLLAVVPFPPRRDATHGGGRIAAEILLRLAEEHDVALLCLRGADDPPLDALTAAAFSLHFEFPRPAHSDSRWIQRVRRAGALARGRPLQDLERASRDLEAEISRVAQTWKPDACQLHWVEMAQYAPAVAPVPTVLIAHEIPSTRAAEELSGLSARIESTLWRRLERRALRNVQATVVFTEEDRGDLLQLVPDARVEVIPFAVELPGSPADPLGDGETVLFVGNFRHTPNVDAALHLAQKIFPLVLAARPAARLRVVGAQPPPSVRELAGDRVEVAADVPDVSRELDRATVVALPLRLGGGMRVKTLEALAAGKAVVGSTLALRGTGVVTGREALIADGDDDSARAIVSLLGDEERRRRLGQAGRAWAETHTWDPYVRRHEELLRSLT